MHELSVTESLLKTAIEYAEKNRASRVNKLSLSIGALAGIIGDSVQFYWDIVSKDTICENASIEFNHIPAKFLCLDCDTTFEIESSLTPCPNCKGIKLQMVQGKEFMLDSIEIETVKEDQ